MVDNYNQEREFGWDDVIQKDSDEFTILEEGDYNFVVTNFERGRHAGSDNLPPCNKATVHIKIDGPTGSVTLKHSLFLHSKTEGLLSAFFAAIGQKKKGETLKMNWNTVIGSTGRLKLGIRDWTSKSGNPMQSNEVSKFYPKEEQPAPTGFTAGRF